jgi:hypothetical protein
MLRAGDNVYTYSSIIAHPSYVRGPYQFRQMGIYPPPYGNGSAGLECRDFDWTASESLINDYLIAINSGACFLANGADWTIFTTTGGVVNWYRNRARFYSANAQIGKLYHTLSNKVWVTGGFGGVSLVSGTRARHAEGDIVTYELSGSIKCFWYMGAGGADNTTITDLIDTVCRLSGAVCTFSGDYTDASLVLSGSEVEVVDLPYVDGADIYYSTASPLDHVLSFGCSVKSDNYENGALFVDDTSVAIAITHVGSGVYTIEAISLPSATVLYSRTYSGSAGLQSYRALLHENSISFYQNNKWIDTICFDELEYENSLSISFNGTGTITNILLRELGDWREAIYIDLETDGRSALSSILQQRPVTIISNWNGYLDIFYEKTRDTITSNIEPRSHRNTRSVPRDGASDAIVYGSKDVKTIVNEYFARGLGFATKLIRVPDLNVGAFKAANIILKNAYEQSNTSMFIMRPNLQLIVGDVLVISYIAGGTDRAYSGQIIVDGLALEIKTVGSKLTSKIAVDGRQSLTGAYSFWIGRCAAFTKGEEPA